MKRLSLILLSLFLLSACEEKASSNSSPKQEHDTNQVVKTPIETYQIGSTWGRQTLTPDLVEGLEMAAIKRAYSHSGKMFTYVGHGTVTYIGLIQGRHVAFTNYHVAFDRFTELMTICDNQVGGVPKSFFGSIYFPSIKGAMGCRQVISYWPEIDIALIEIDDFKAGTKLDQLAPLRFRFHKEIEKGLDLLTAGYGDYQNPNHKLTATWEEECKVFDEKSYIVEEAVIEAPSEDGKLKVPTQFSGCDISTGDSGSAVFDRRSDIVVGINWMSGTEKFKEDLTDDFVLNLFNQNRSELFTRNLSGFVPAPVIYERLSEWLEEESPESDAAKIVTDLLNQFSE